MGKEITCQDLAKLEKAFAKDRISQALQHACFKSPISSVVYVPNRRPATTRKFSIELKTLDACNQKNTGRCWIFAGCNLLREIAAKKMNVEQLELSQTFVGYYDKLEKINHQLESILELADCPDDDRTLYTINECPLLDGGQWDMFRSLIRKYGIVPKNAMDETYESSHTKDSNALINARIRAFEAEARRLVRAGKADEARAMKEKVFAQCYNVITVAYGNPPKTFTLEYTDKDDVYHCVPDMTPKRFYEEFIGADMDEYVSIIHSPTQDKPYHKTYTVDYLGNVIGGQPIHYLNIPMDEMKKAVVDSLKAGEPVWFGSDCSRASDREAGIWDPYLYDYKTAFGFDIVLDKADALNTGGSAMNHAMLITGVNLTDGDKPNRWKIENSWGTDVAEKGYYVATDEWFDLYVYQAVVRRSFLTKKSQKDLDQEPIHLPLWDPMGTLAD